MEYVHHKYSKKYNEDLLFIMFLVKIYGRLYHLHYLHLWLAWPAGCRAWFEDKRQDEKRTMMADKVLMRQVEFITKESVAV